MDPIKDYADTVVAEAIAAGKPKEEAEALRPAAEEEAKKVAAHPLFKKFEGHAKKRFDEHDALKKEVAPLKTAAQKLKELEDKGKSDADRLAEENKGLKAKADRAEALEAEVKNTFDAEAEGLSEEQLAVIVGETPEARLAHLRKLKKAGMLGEQKKTNSPGNKMPGEPGAMSMKREAFQSLPPTKRMEFLRKGGKLVD